MAVYKCKMCGGTLEISEGMTICECEYCGTKQTLPKTDNERNLNMFNRANHFRQQCEFDKAAEIYEKMSNSSEGDSELYWSMLLCRYGIEYVDDPLTKKKIPTCHRTQIRSILDDPDYHIALEYADLLQRSIYESEAAYIDKVQKGIIEISKKEEPFDVFICYKETDEDGRRTRDSVLAQELYYGLTQEGFKVFFSRITLESKLGSEYEPYIFAALKSSKVMVVIGTKPDYYNAVWVRNEWSRYLMLMQEDRSRTIIPAYKDMDPYELPDALSMFQAQDMSKLGFMQDLIRGIKKIIKIEPETIPVQQNITQNSDGISELIIDGAMYSGETFAGKPNGQGRIEYESGAVYEGGWKLGKRHGQGKLTHTDGTSFTGEFRDNDCFKGNGTVKFNDGVYDGEVVDGQRNGRGKMACYNGKTLEGEFKNGILIKGKETYANGDVFEGDKNGNGKYISYDGSIIEGEFKEGKLILGKGTRIYESGQYTGEFNSKGKHGKGVLTLNNGTQIEGEFRDDEPINVSGTIVFEDGTFTGTIVEGKKEGNGIFISNDGSRLEGEFRNDEPINVSGTIVSKDGCFTGTIVEGKREGKGHLIYGDTEFDGYFKDDNFYEGELKYASGGIFKGEFKNGMAYKGILTHPNGTNVEGEFLDGKPYSVTGTLIINNSRYTGSYVEGKKEGRGELIYNGLKYNGVFKNNCFVEGEVTNTDGTTFIGTLQNMLPYSGRGTWIYNDGRFTGDYLEGKKHGNGKLEFNNGIINEGVFIKDAFVEGTITNTDGTAYTGKVQNGLPYSGKGTWIYSDGRYTGEFFEGKKHGKGKLVLDNGLINEGEFRNGMLNGYGMCVNTDGTIYKGGWLNNKCHGTGVFFDKDGKRYAGRWENGNRVGVFDVYPPNNGKPYKEKYTLGGILQKALFGKVE